MEWSKLLGFFEKRDKESKGLVSKETISITDTITFEQAYRSWLIEECTYLTDLPLGPFEKFPSLSDLYCQPQFQQLDVPYFNQIADSEKFSLDRVMAQHKQILFIASAGYGKTTLCRFLALSAANFVSTKEDETFAVYVPLKLLNHTQDIDVLEATASIEILFRLILPKHIIPDLQAIQTLESKLKAGKCLLLFDGLDDIIDDDVFEHWLEVIGQFAKKYSGNYIVVTSNQHQIDSCVNLRKDNTIVHDFKSYGLMPFSDSDIESYVGKHSRHLTEALGLETTIKPEAFIEQLQSDLDISEICRNPMLLCMMFALYTDKVNLESDFAQLFESYIQQCLQWYCPESCHPLQWQFVLERIAYTMQKNSTPYIFENWCKKVLMSEFDSLDLPLTPDELDDVLDSCSNPQSLLKTVNFKTEELSTDYQKNILEFNHKSFQDFLTAKQLHHKALEGFTLVKSDNFGPLRRWHQGKQSVLLFYTMLAKSLVASKSLKSPPNTGANSTSNSLIKADEVIHWLLSLKDSEQEALFCASELALYSNAVSNIAIERIQDELDGVIAFETGYLKSKADLFLKQLVAKYRITNDVLLTFS